MKKILVIVLVVLGVQFSFSQAPISVANKSVPVVFESVENTPVFPGGLGEFRRFIANNFKAPEVEGLSGVMNVTFVIEINGSVSDIKIQNDLGGGCGEEIKRVLQMCPRWEPGTQSGKPVRVLYSFTFTIAN